MNSFDFKSFKTVSSNKNNFTNTSSLSKSTQTASISNPSNSTQSPNTQTLVKGQIIKAEVIDLRGRDLKIHLNNSEIISGKINSDISLSIGEQVTFQVEDASLTSITLKVMVDNRLTSQSIIIDKALEDANLPKTDKSIQIVLELLKNQMSIDKDSLLQIFQQSITFKNASIQSLVLMNKLGVELNDLNTTQFEAYQNYEHRLVNGSDLLLNTIIEALPQASNEVAIKLNQLLLDLSTRPFVSSRNMSVNENNNLASPFTATDKTAASIHNLNNLGNTNGVSTPSLIETVLETPLPYEESVSLNAEHSFHIDMDSNLPPLSTIGSFTDTSSILMNHLLNDSERKSLVQAFPPEIQKVIAENVMEDPSSIVDAVSVIKNHLDALDSTQLQALLQTPAYHSLLKECIMSQWTLNPNTLKKLTNIDKFYEKLESDFKELVDFFNKTSKESFDHSFESASKQAKNLQDNIDFMKTLNQLFPYVQLPMKLSNQNVHSELYVYKRKKSTDTENNNISVLLHLDMEQLGPLDIHLDLIKTHIATKIYTENKDSKFLFDANIGLLKTALENKGYSFTFEIIKRAKDNDLVQEIQKNADPFIGMKRYSFDIRA